MQIKQIAEQCLRDESNAVLALISQLDDNFEAAVRLLFACKGHVIVSGVGKSGHVGQKIAATMASTGTPAFYINPLDALHGDLGMVTENDVALLISNSGSSDEILRIVSALEEQHIPIISITGHSDSILAKHSNYHILVSVDHEACPLNLAPTSSTTAVLAMGDAMACALMELRDFKSNDFARFHPAGSLGKRLVTRVKDVMYKDNLPIFAPDVKMIDAIVEISRHQLGVGVVMDGGKLLGLITDGDIRRAVENRKRDVFDVTVAEAMTKNPKTIGPDARLAEVQEIFQRYLIRNMPVVDKDGRFVGLIDNFAVNG